MLKKILLIQPRHIYAPDFGEKKFGHIYMPTSLLAVASIFIELGLDVNIVDENIEPVDINTNFVGINLLGAPYIPVVSRFEKLLYKKYKDNYTLLIGGQIVNGLSEIDFKNLFSNQTINGNSYHNLSKLLGVEESDIPKIENLSLQKAYDLLSEKYLKLYIEREFGFYLSQGCKHSCSFCSASRTIIINGKVIKAKETYRNIEIALSDFEFLLQKASDFGFNKVNVYLSNLDLFQTPLNLFSFATGLNKLKEKYQNITIFLRGLPTVLSFLEAHNNYPYVINELHKAGLFRIGFGIDGATQNVYKRTRKPQKIHQSIEAIRIAKEVYNITPETLMVFGHNDIEDENSLSKAVKLCKDMQQKYGALPRPHISKNFVPGNDGWNNPINENVRVSFYNNPFLFQSLDFTAMPSTITHPEKSFRELASIYYKQACELPDSLTQYVLPEQPTMSIAELVQVKQFNKERYDL